MRDDDTHSRRVRFYPFELDFNTGDLCKHRQRIRLQPQPLQILMALLAKPGEIILREELRERLWPGNVFVDYEHSLNRSMNKLRRALGDRVVNPRYIETLHGLGYRFIAPVESGFLPGRTRLAVLPVVNVTGSRENDDLADGITEALIDGSRCGAGQRLRVVALASVLCYRNKRMGVARIAAELKADYLVCGRLRTSDGLFRLRVELLDARDQALRWAESYIFVRESVDRMEKEICAHIADSVEPETSYDPATTPLEPDVAKTEVAIEPH